MTPRLDELRRIYRRRFPDEDRNARTALWQVLVEGFFQRWIDRRDVVVDLGCGYGEWLNHVRAARRIGVDLNPDSADHLDPEVEFHRGSVSELDFLPDASVDVVFTSNVMEHLADKAQVETMIREVRRILKPGGSFIAMGPNLRFLPGTYWDFWDHFVPITDRSLAEVLEVLGLEVVDVIPKFLPYTTRSSLPQAPWMVGLYLRFRPAWRLLGKQFLIRARAPEAPR